MAEAHDRASQFLAGPSAVTLELEVPRSGQPAPPPRPANAGGKDPLSDVLHKVKLTGALFFLVEATYPWGVEVPEAASFASMLLPEAQHAVSYHVILEGEGWVSLGNAGFRRFEAGDILVMAHGDPYAMLSAPDQPPEFDRETTLEFFRDMAAGRLPFVIEEGGGGRQRTRFVCGYLGCDVKPFNPVLSTLPRFLHVKRGAAAPAGLLDRLIDLTLSEARKPGPGGESVRLRLSELLFVEVVRRYLEALPSGQGGWLSGLKDPAVGCVLSLLHESPARSWSLKELAERAGVSRAVLAERFAELVGCPPMQYLALWRMQLAARLLSDGAMKVAAVAHAVGYESEAAFSRAFKKATGLSPMRWRNSRAG